MPMRKRTRNPKSKSCAAGKTPLKFYDLSAKKTFTTSDYKNTKKKGRNFAVAKSPSGGTSWRIMGK